MFGAVPNITSSQSEDVQNYWLVLVDSPDTISKPPVGVGMHLVQLERARCRTDLVYETGAGNIRETRIFAGIGSMPPGWFRAAQPCIARGLLAAVGLVGNSCVIRPSALCPQDDARRVTQADFVVVQALQHVRRQQRRGDANATRTEPADIVRFVLAEEPYNSALINLRRARLREFLRQFERGWRYMTASDEQLREGDRVPPSTRWRWILNLRAM